MFGDDDDGDLFSTKKGSVAAPSKPKTKAAAALFGDDDDDGVGQCLYDREETTFVEAKDRCLQAGYRLCPVDEAGDLDVYECNYRKWDPLRMYSWTSTPCAVKAQVNALGKVSTVHSTNLRNERFQIDSGILSRVSWDGGRFPTAESSCAADGDACSVHGATCVCDTTVTTGGLHRLAHRPHRGGGARAAAGALPAT